MVSSLWQCTRAFVNHCVSIFGQKRDHHYSSAVFAKFGTCQFLFVYSNLKLVIKDICCKDVRSNILWQHLNAICQEEFSNALQWFYERYTEYMAKEEMYVNNWIIKFYLSVWLFDLTSLGTFWTHWVDSRFTVKNTSEMTIHTYAKLLLNADVKEHKCFCFMHLLVTIYSNFTKNIKDILFLLLTPLSSDVFWYILSHASR